MAVSPEEPIFTMHGARTAIKLGMLHIEEQVKALELAVVDNTGLALDLARTVIESTCRTILTERGIPYDKDDNLPRLFKTVTQVLPFLPAAMATDAGARKSLEQTLSGLSTAIQGVCELRKAFGFASHGRDGPRPEMEATQALLVAQAADAIVGFLYGVHRQDLLQRQSVPPRYDDHPDFNDWIDERNELIRIFTMEYKPSEVLFNVDLQAYCDLLASYETDDETEEQSNQVGEEGEVPE